MGYRINAFVARAGTFAPFQHLSPCLTIVPLANTFEMLINEWYIGDILAKEPKFSIYQGNIKDLYAGFNLSSSLVNLGLSLSQHQTIAYIEADFFGGSGNQHAVVWHQGQIVLMPQTNGLWSSSYKEHGFSFPEDGPINQALRAIGFKSESGPEWDEFSSIGLMENRDNYDWFHQYNTSPDKDNCHDDEI
jgi:hypothetical protein